MTERLRAVLMALLSALALPAGADDFLWKRLATEPDLVVLMRHTQPAGGNPLAWDVSGRCEGESMLTAEGRAHAKRIGDAFSARGIRPTVISSPMCRCRDTARIAFGGEPSTDGELREVANADAERMNAFERKAQALIAARRGAAPIVFVSHRPNIDRLTLELIDSGELLVGRAGAGGEIDVLGKIAIP
ncbi:MAG: histidine phosphatase family protein [Usitatibacter sp.]